MLIEVKHGYEDDPFERLENQADDYLRIARERRAVLMYRFYNDPQSGSAKALFEHLKELYKDNKDVLRIFVKGVEWTEGQ